MDESCYLKTVWKIMFWNLGASWRINILESPSISWIMQRWVANCCRHTNSDRMGCLDSRDMCFLGLSMQCHGYSKINQAIKICVRVLFDPSELHFSVPVAPHTTSNSNCAFVRTHINFSSHSRDRSSVPAFQDRSLEYVSANTCLG